MKIFLKRDFTGFTLIEFIVVIVIIGIIFALGSKILFQGFQSYFDNKSLIDSDWQARLSLERMQRDFRSVRSTADISTATSNNLVFVATNGNTISYSLSGTTLYRQTNSNTAQPLATGVKAVAFAYYDDQGNVASTNANIRYWTIALSFTPLNGYYTVSTEVYGRNLP